MGRWVDFDNDYKTMDPTFMESVWWVFKKLWESRTASGQPRVYKAHRIMPYSWKLTTPLSNFEAGGVQAKNSGRARIFERAFLDHQARAAFFTLRGALFGGLKYELDRARDLIAHLAQHFRDA